MQPCHHATTIAETHTDKSRRHFNRHTSPPPLLSCYPTHTAAATSATLWHDLATIC
jgi:hypothetical protein